MAYDVILCTTPSDAHTWNLVFLELWLRERGLRVRCLGACTEIAQIVRCVRDDGATLLAVSTLNGLGGWEALEIATEIRGLDVRAAIGGILAMNRADEESRIDRLREAGFEVFTGDGDLDRFDAYLRALFPHYAVSDMTW